MTIDLEALAASWRDAAMKSNDGARAHALAEWARAHGDTLVAELAVRTMERDAAREELRIVLSQREPADERLLDVEHDVIVYSDAAVATSRDGSACHLVREGSAAERSAASAFPLRMHIVRVRYRVPLPPEPVTVEAEVDRE